MALRMKCPPGILCLNQSFMVVVAVAVVAVLAAVYLYRRVDNVKLVSEAPLPLSLPQPQQPLSEPIQITVVPSQHNLVPPSPERFYDSGPVIVGSGATNVYPSAGVTGVYTGGPVAGGPGVVRTEVPMTIATSGGPSPYQQVGVMRKDGEDEDIMLPVFGRRLQPNRDRWNYYTAGVAGTLPVRIQNRDCMDQYVGCDELFDGDTVTVDGMKNGVYKVMMYTVSTPIRY